ncbi:MAG: type III-B CRISPR-associated protein Cas10/Cmr2 [Gammaproteobacteria bacterium]|nr:type III-B CRISPR-associated protein Cas10/Cmr2 [Gammaproteobacteria bacterium]
MDELAFWKQKLIQFFHDPPGKPFASYPGSGGHAALAKQLFEYFTGQTLHGYNRYPDWAASGADRPMLSQPKGKSIAQVQLGWHKCPILTHPLCRAQLRVNLGETLPGPLREAGVELLEDQLDALDEFGAPDFDWQDAAALRRACARLWRRFREELSAAAAGHRLLWAEMPADGRVPDHSIWDHLRMTSALAFLPAGVKNKRPLSQPQHPRCPWLLRFSLHPVQRFIGEARTSRDLWIGSFLLADLAWHAMGPVVQRYGHDAIVYPDLRGNPMVDNWLAAPGTDKDPELDNDPELLPPNARGAVSFASLLPANFTALVPYGGADSYLLPLEKLARDCADAVQQRWQELAGQVERWMVKQADIGPGPWQKIWQRQQQQAISCAWSAVAWLPPEPLEDPQGLRGRALPAQRADFRSGRAAGDQANDQAGASDRANDQANIDARRTRLAPWVPAATWQHYERARAVYAQTHLRWHQMERGFDYALIHHQLSARHALRCAQAPAAGALTGEPGESCTCCGRRQALSNEFSGHIARDRQHAKAFWRVKALDPEESGGERLCGVCAVKRFLVIAGWDGQRMTGINPLWAGYDLAEQREALDRDSKPRVPFPSTATVAAQRFIEALITTPALEPALAAVVRAHRGAGLPATSFPRALPRLAAAAQRTGSATARRFVELEAEEVLFPEALQGQQQGEQARQQQAEREGRQRQQRDLEPLIKAVQALRKAARRELPKSKRTPNTRIAVLMMDGDRIGSLLLGERGAINARWRDVIHPEAVAQMQSMEKPRPRLHAAGWPDLLEAKRLTGPSLHAYISRALAAFSHRIVPWVVEREFSGRLIYAGGDELLCLVPGAEALALAARLQQLFCAPWIIDTQNSGDTQADEDRWPWRRRDWQGPYDQVAARRRFAIPVYRRGEPITLPIGDTALLEPHAAAGPDSQCPEQYKYPELRVQGAVIPLLGGGQSLSAGIACGHYKRPLHLLLGGARRMLKDHAKVVARGRGGALAISYASRGGEKYAFAMPWRAGACDHLSTVIAGFENGRIAKRLPYKLREIAAPVAGVMREVDDPGREQWLRNLFAQAQALDDAKTGLDYRDPDYEEAAFAIWRQGLRLHHDHQLQRATDGLLLCRALAGGEEAEQA